ncbi:hypothetical protein AB4099_18045 [Bosea sp. 2KB_26]|uniref:hypothetical protein n=1 Tax=Bosea sp. 2KB_26 TaxID=3237475 RepID=UPI003F8F119C
MKKAIQALCVVPALIGAGALVLPRGWNGLQLQAAAHDPVALSDLRLQGVLASGRIAEEIDAAIAAGDTELGGSFVDLAAEHRITVTEDQRERLARLQNEATTRALKDFGSGFVSGERVSNAGFAGAVVSDVVGVGDLRDLAGEGQKLLRGETTDYVVLVLAAGGLALSVATWASLGSGLPARGGLSVVKATAKAGMLSPKLTANLTRMAAGAVDLPALTASLTAAARFDLAAARASSAAIVRPAAMTRLATLGQDAGALYARTGQAGLRQVLAVADNAGDIGRAARLSAAKGSTTRAVLKVLGRSALVLGALSLTTTSWIFALFGYAVALAMLAQRFGWWLGRLGSARRRQNQSSLRSV